MDRLTELRESIADVDRALLELLRRRMALAADVGEIKARTGAPVVVADVEEHVLTRARQHAEACGVSEDVMASVFAAIIRGSVERQHRVGVSLRSRRGRRVLVLGGAGGMGGWFQSFLELVGHRVDAVDPAWRDLPPAPGRLPSLDDVPSLDAYEFVVVAVPLADTPAVMGGLVERRPRGVVVEVTSIKSHLVDTLARADAAGVRVSCLHPMFGPGKSPYEPLTFVLATRADPTSERARIEQLTSHPYTRMVVTPFAHHDRLMGWLLGLAHLSGIVFGSALTRSGLDPAELFSAASTTFERQASTAMSVLSEDPELYLDIQRLNPHRQEVYDAVREALADVVTQVEDDRREEFRTALATASRNLRPESS